LVSTKNVKELQNFKNLRFFRRAGYRECGYPARDIANKTFSLVKVAASSYLQFHPAPKTQPSAAMTHRARRKVFFPKFDRPGVNSSVLTIPN